MKKLMVFGISLFILLMVSLVSAEEIVFQYPERVNSTQVFSVNLTLVDFDLDTYDVKIHLTRNNETRSIGQILNGSDWISTQYYVNSIINTSLLNSSIFSLNITEEYEGIANLTVKVREIGGDGETYGEYQINVTSPPVQNTPPPQNNDPDISLEVEWDEDDIRNGEEFDIKVFALNLKDEDYDIKIYIVSEDDEDNIISETYHEKDEKWKSSSYYVKEVVSGEGDDSETFSLRMDEDYEGDAILLVKIRDSETQSLIDEIEEDIEILKKEEKEEDQEDKEEEEDENDVESSETTITGSVIKLENKNEVQDEENNEKSEGNENKILYESGSEKIKKYAIYGLNILLVVIMIILIKKKI